MKTIMINGVKVTTPGYAKIKLIGSTNPHQFTVWEWSPGFVTERVVEIGCAT